MRPKRLLTPRALLVFFATASPAAAFDWSVNVIDYEFQPKAQQIAVGDSVTWNFAVPGHTTTSKRGQPDSQSEPLVRLVLLPSAEDGCL